MAFTSTNSMRRIIGIILLISFCASVLPIVVPQPLPPKSEQSEPFACQDRGCGCRSADQCWSHCCCFSLSERVAWAKKNGVTPPSHVLATLRDQEDTSKPRASLPVARNCCSKEKKSASTSRLLATSELSKPSCSQLATQSDCCDKKTNLHQTSSPPAIATVSKRPKKQGFVLTLMALKCQGKGSLFTSLPWCDLSGQDRFAFQPEMPSEPVAFSSVKAVCLRTPPDIPRRDLPRSRIFLFQPHLLLSDIVSVAGRWGMAKGIPCLLRSWLDKSLM